MRDSFVLFCAGEDSGDILGESLVRECVRLGLQAQGVGGCRMQNAGLASVADYETLPVSGFGDVLPRFFRLRTIFSQLETLLRSENCVALVCIDYPGFNMKLVQMAERLNKSALYVAPPQVWAWKSSRVKKLRKAHLAVLFDFERRVYESYGVAADLLKHPFPRVRGKNDEKRILLLPGSRLLQAIRNISFFKAVATQVHAERLDYTFVVAVSRAEIRSKLENAFSQGEILPDWLSFEDVPQKAQLRAEFYSRFPVALCIPGSATLELALSGVTPVVTDVLDSLTYFMCKHFVKADYFALPNVLLSRKAIPECYFTTRTSRKSQSVREVACLLQNAIANPVQSLADELESTFVKAKSPDLLMTEFLREFFEREAH